ncbi:Wadjet anti-phage system protein JetD domain-containing protein [Kitasatospora sp. NPDC005751]|uniref:Wadjet anti-phage system protein JetD domain-containing protein n=1 Tax=Kitasatospora sp. NPDC005751 TaxID=3157064 RepID=UPI0033E76D85
MTPPNQGPLPRRERELIERLRQWAKDNGRDPATRTQIPLDTVWAAFRAISNRNPEAEYEPALLACILEELEQQAAITRFKQHTPDRVPLPVKIWLLPQPRPARTVQPMPIWAPALSWLAAHWVQATRKQKAAYTAINQWHKSGPDLFPLPIRERALEIFGTFGSETDFPMPEKTFDTLKSGPLFGDPALLDAAIAALRPPPPLITESFPQQDEDEGHYRRVGTGDTLLVVENATTWWSLAESLPSDHSLGYIAWGLGGTFQASVRAISAKHRITRIRYFGDLDLSGLRIPTNASQTASELGLPPVQPAPTLYRMLLELGRPRSGKESPADPAVAISLAHWLPAPQQHTAAGLLTRGQRLAQEWVNYRHLQQTTDWHADIR